MWIDVVVPFERPHLGKIVLDEDGIYCCDRCGKSINATLCEVPQ